MPRQTNEFGEIETEPEWLPTPEQIAAECAAIRREREASPPAAIDNDNDDDDNGDDNDDDDERERSRRVYQARYRERRRLERLKQ